MMQKITKLHKNDKLRKRKNLKWNKSCAQFSFNRNLSSKAYHGQIVFDDKKMTMDPVVRTDMKMGDDEDEQSRCVPVRQLSGGERSFSSMCLVLALKAATQTPFLALDEFDVFMDERNRRLSLNILTDVLRLHGDSQTIIISPLSLSAIDAKDGVKKILIRPVDRHQRSLNFSQPQL